MHLRRADSRTILYVVILFAIVSACAFTAWGTNGIYVSLVVMLVIVLAGGFKLYRMLSHKFDLQASQSHALFNIYSKVPAGITLPAPHGWTANIHLLEFVVDFIFHRRPKLVVELGSGLSSIYIGHFLKQQGHGQLISLEHDTEYANQTRKSIDEHGLAEFVTIVDAPLVERTIGQQTVRWYDTSAVNLNGAINMLIVDGPPWQSGPLARYPALPVFVDALDHEAVVVLDDSKRKDESRIVKRWLDEFPSLSHRMIFSEKGLSVFDASQQPTS